MTRASGLPVLEVRDLRVHFELDSETTEAVRDVSFDLFVGETLAIVGESGSGKSVTAQALMALVDCPPGRVIAGDVKLEGRSLLAHGGKLAREVRGRKIGMVFQDALAALDPGVRIGSQISELFRCHLGLNRRAANHRTCELMERVGIPDPRQLMSDYPHQFSGGMRQRIAIAIAIALEPIVVIADEPTTALDVTVQAQIMELLAEIGESTGAGVILITHDLAVVSTYASRLAVMYAGHIVESGPTQTVLSNPAHPYTRGLIDSIPSTLSGMGELKSIPGQPPDLARLPPGCAFEPRCWLGNGRTLCSSKLPEMLVVGQGRQTACHYASECMSASVVT